MNRNLIQQRNSLSYKNTTNLSQNSFLQQAIPKYRKQVFERSFQVTSIDRTSRIKEKYKNFGEEEFIKKLKYNSTKQIDRKSIKVIEKYLHELSQQKIQPLGYLSRSTSLQGLTIFDSRTVNENEQIAQLSNPKFSKTNSTSITPGITKAKSDQIVKTNFFSNKQSKLQRKRQLNYPTKNKNRNSSKDLEQKIDQNTIRESANFNYQQGHSLHDKNNYVEQGINLGGMSFRYNTTKMEGQKQKQCQDQQRTLKYQTSQNNFYHKVPSHNPLQNYNNDAKHKKNLSILDGAPKKDSLLQLQLRALIEKNAEQEEIIKLQQIMIQKLNFQLDTFSRKIEQNKAKQIKNCENQTKQSLVQQKNNSTNHCHSHQDQQILSKQLCLNAKNISFNEVQSSVDEWNQNLSKLKTILRDMAASQQIIEKIEYPDKKLKESQFSSPSNKKQNINNEKQSNQPKNCLQSMNQFYHGAIHQTPKRKEFQRIQTQTDNYLSIHSKDRRLSELSNLYSRSSKMERRDLEYSAGTDRESDSN